MTNTRVLIIGGTGVFGKRLAAHLADVDGINLIVSSRSQAKAEQLATYLNQNTEKSHVRGIALDHAKNLAAQLDNLQPFAVIDCSGPFQTANYDSARAILGSGAHLIDLADARDYLAGFAINLGHLAVKNGVSAMTGASSTPTLSTCVTNHIAAHWKRVDSIDICITPGGKSEVGQSVIAAILSYAGKSIPIWRDGKRDNAIGWTTSQSVVIPKLGKRRVALVETYDAEYLGNQFKVKSRISFSAGLESRIEQFGVETLAQLRKRKLIGDLSPLIPLLLRARKVTRLATSDCGGMMVKISGLDAQGVFCIATWSLVASNDHGPNIPILPAAAALQNLRDGIVPKGAMLSHQQVALSQILAQMAPYEIDTETNYAKIDGSIFETYLSPETYQTLPRAVQDFHAQTAAPVWTGRADIETGNHLIAKVAMRLFGFPAAGSNVPVKVRVDRFLNYHGHPRERWTRIFSDRIMSSVLSHQKDGEFTETFGPFTFVLGITATPKGIEMPVKKWRLGRIPLPLALAPQSQARENQDEHGRFRFDVRLSLPLVGLMVHYKGWLAPQT